MEKYEMKRRKQVQMLSGADPSWGQGGCPPTALPQKLHGKKRKGGRRQRGKKGEKKKRRAGGRRKDMSPQSTNCGSATDVVLCRSHYVVSIDVGNRVTTHVVTSEYRSKLKTKGLPITP